MRRTKSILYKMCEEKRDNFNGLFGRGEKIWINLVGELVVTFLMDAATGPSEGLLCDEIQACEKK